MDIKRLLIIFLILFFLPIVLGKVDFSPFQFFFQQPTWDNFRSAFTNVLQDDWNFYINLITPWIAKLKDLIQNWQPTSP